MFPKQHRLRLRLRRRQNNIIILYYYTYNNNCLPSSGGGLAGWLSIISISIYYYYIIILFTLGLAWWMVGNPVAEKNISLPACVTTFLFCGELIATSGESLREYQQRCLLCSFMLWYCNPDSLFVVRDIIIQMNTTFNTYSNVNSWS